MSLTPAQQFQELLKKTVAPLILLPRYPSRDALATAFALAFFLKNAGKEAIIAGENIDQDKERIAFLTPPDQLLSSIKGARDFVLAFNTGRNKIIDVRTERLSDELRIYLTPEHGSIDPRDFSFIPAQFKYDLAVVIGSADKESLGTIFEDNPDIFYEIPIVNIDNHSENELFGQVNLVDITASSKAEILVEILEKTTPALLDERVSECLLTGLISATDSFQKKNTTPKALHLASRLMDRGVDQQKIIRSLYKTQPLHLLKLWGRVMAQLKWNEQLKLVWALVTIEDLVQTRTKSEDLTAVLDKIKSNYASAQLFVILHPETATRVHGTVKAVSSENLALFAQHIPGELRGTTFHFTLDVSSLDEAERIIVDKVQAFFVAPKEQEE